MKKRGKIGAGRIERELNQTMRLSKHRGELNAFRDHRDHGRASLCGGSL